MGHADDRRTARTESDERNFFGTTTGDVNEEFARLTRMTMDACVRADAARLSLLVEHPLIPYWGLDAAIRPRDEGPPPNTSPDYL